MAGRIYTFRDIDQNVEERCDVVVIGSGAGGAVCATELAEAGFDVVLLEEGGYYRTEDFSTDSIEGGKRLFRHGGMGMAIGRPPVLFSEGRCVGGSIEDTAFRLIFINQTCAAQCDNLQKIRTSFDNMACERHRKESHRSLL